MLIAFLAGLASVAAFAPLAWFPIAWASLGILFFLALLAPDARTSARYGFAFGLGAFLGGISWVYVSLSVFGGMVPPLAAAATVALCALMAVYPGFALWLFGHLQSPGWRIPLFAASWTLGEGLRGWLFTGFPWLAIGYSQTGASPLGGYAPFVGVYGVSFLTALVAAGLGEMVWRWRSGECPNSGHPRWAYAAFPALVAVLLVAGGAVAGMAQWTEPVGKPLRVALLQGNIAQDLKWRPETFYQSLNTYQRLVADTPADLTVLPETALPAYWEALPPSFVESVGSIARSRGGDVLIGAIAGDAERYFNAVISVGSAPSQRYHKRHLVPFGEFVPPGFSWLMAQMSIPMAGFTAGSERQAPLLVAGVRVAPNICYEDLFGNELRATAREAEILVNVSNTAWFGRSLAQSQHLQIAQMRARETGRPMLRATNTGMTAVVTPDGAVAAVLPPFTQGALSATVQGMSGETPYLRWGDAPIWLLTLGLVISVAFARRYRSDRGRSG